MKKKQRFYFILFILAALASATALSLFALQDNIAFFYAPSDVARLAAEQSPRVAPGAVFRLGGMVEKGSLSRDKKTAAVSFTVTDGAKSLRVSYRGLLPDLFREGQGVVATGHLNDNGRFTATEILAKHDEKYMPPQAARALERAGENRAPAP